MKFCSTHWEDLRAAIAARGLDQFVAADGKEAVDAMVRQLEGTTEREDFDPLMNAHWAIFSKGLEAGGLYLMGQPQDGSNDGHYCPLCELDKQTGPGGPSSVDWITFATNEQFERAKSLGLINPS